MSHQSQVLIFTYYSCWQPHITVQRIISNSTLRLHRCMSAWVELYENVVHFVPLSSLNSTKCYVFQAIVVLTPSSSLFNTCRPELCFGQMVPPTKVCSGKVLCQMPCLYQHYILHRAPNATCKCISNERKRQRPDCECMVWCEYNQKYQRVSQTNDYCENPRRYNSIRQLKLLPS